jgi:lipoprotein LpqH
MVTGSQERPATPRRKRMNTLFRTTNRIRIAAFAVGLGAVVALTGCSSDAGDAPEEAASQPAAEQPAAESEAPVDDAPAEGSDDEDAGEDTATGTGSEVSITIDGEALEIADPTVVCQEIDGTMPIAVGSTTGTDGIGATLTPGDAPTVKTVALGSLDGTAMAWAEGAPGEANATKDGSTYTISGSMAAVDMSDPTNMDETPFEMVIVCP